jgi:TonB family protein
MPTMLWRSRTTLWRRCPKHVMVSAILAFLLATMAIAQARPTTPRVTPRRSLPIRQGPVTFVDSKSPCPPHKDEPVRVGSVIVNPSLLEYTPPRVAPSTGRVIVEATIQDDGTVGSVRVLRGPKELHEFALEAVRQWKFARTCLNGTATWIVHTVVLTFPGREGAASAAIPENLDSTFSPIPLGIALDVGEWSCRAGPTRLRSPLPAGPASAPETPAAGSNSGCLGTNP